MAEAAAIAAPKPDTIPMHFELNGHIIDSAVIKPMSFSAYDGFIDEAISMTTPPDIDTRLRRLRMAKQFIYQAGGNVVPVSTDDVTRMPIPDAHRVIARLGNLFGGFSPGWVATPFAQQASDCCDAQD